MAAVLTPMAVLHHNNIAHASHNANHVSSHFILSESLEFIKN